MDDLAYDAGAIHDSPFAELGSCADYVLSPLDTTKKMPHLGGRVLKRRVTSAPPPTEYERG